LVRRRGPTWALLRTGPNEETHEIARLGPEDVQALHDALCVVLADPPFSADDAAARAYLEWCAANPDDGRRTQGPCGPEVSIRAHVPLKGIVAMLRGAGYSPTPPRLEALLERLQDHLADPDGFPCPAGVMDRLIDEACEVVDSAAQEGLFEGLDGDDAEEDDHEA
jgi:hypothetical protein